MNALNRHDDTSHPSKAVRWGFMVLIAIALCFHANLAATAPLKDRIHALEAKETIRSTIHAFVRALNSSYLEGATDPLGPVAGALHPEVILVAVPPPSESVPVPEPLTFAGIERVIGVYGRFVVVLTKPNILVSAIDVELLHEDRAMATMRFANAVNFPAGCLAGSAGCEGVMIFADVTTKLARNGDGVWQFTSVKLVHHLAHTSPTP